MKLTVINMGLSHYGEARAFQEQLIRNRAADTLVLTIHYPVITVGRKDRLKHGDVIARPEEVEKALTIKNITENPVDLSKKMIEMDLASYKEIKAEDSSPGLVLAHQLQIVENEVEKKLSILDGFKETGAGGIPGGTVTSPEGRAGDSGRVA